MRLGWRYLGAMAVVLSVPSWGGPEPSPELPELAQPSLMAPSRFPQQPGEAPAAVTVITRAMIEASGAIQLLDVMRLVPGVMVGTRSVEAPAAAYHGLGDQFARRSLLLLDGDRVFQFSRGVIDWNGIPVALEDIERIEVIRAPNAIYGSNAFDMVINIITRTPAESVGSQIDAGLGSHGQGTLYARQGRSGGRWAWDVWVDGFRDGGYSGLDDDRRIGKVGLASDLALDEHTTVEFRAGLTRGQYNLDEQLTARVRSRREMVNRTDYESLRLRRVEAGGASEWRLGVSRNGFTFGDHGWRSDQVVPGVQLLSSSFIDEERFGIDGEWLGIGDRWKAAVGAGYFHESVRSPGFFATAQSLTSGVYRMFGTGEYRPYRPIWVNAGLMIEIGSLAEEPLLLPRLSLHYQPVPQHILRFVYATGSRQPTLYEDQARAVVVGLDTPLTLYRSLASGNLEPEVKQLFELGWHWRLAPSAQVDARLFHERIDDAIIQYFRVVPGLPTILGGGRVLDFRNLAQSIRTSGFEIAYDQRFNSGALLYAAYAYTDLDSDESTADLAGTQARHTVSVLASVPADAQWTLSAAYHYQSAMHWLLEPPLEPLHDLSITLARELPLGSVVRGRFRVTGQHLLGNYADFLPDREHRTGVFAELRLEF